MQFYHGTPNEIHLSNKPYLDPGLATGRDEGDPQCGHIFATPDLLVASIFAFKTPNCRAIVRTDEGPVAVYSATPPAGTAKGFVYQVPSEGLRQTLRRGQPSGKWAIVEQDMPRVLNPDGVEVPGIPLDEPVRRVTIPGLAAKEALRICLLADSVDSDAFTNGVRDAVHAKTETSFVQHWCTSGLLQDVTSQLIAEVVSNG